MPSRKPRRLVTMTDIARAAGVSVTTVSHALNKSRAVAPETERAVLEAAAALGYVADSVVRSLRTVGTQTIGLAMSAMSNTYFGDVVHSIEQAVSRAGYSLLLADTHDEVPSELRAVADLLSRNVEAIVLAPSADPSRSLQYAARQGVPVVLIDRLTDFDVDQIAVESRRPTAELVTHLHTQSGHQLIAMISGKTGLATTDERIAGYRDGLKASGLRFKTDYLVSGHSTEEGAEAALRQLLALPKPPTAVVVANNQMTIGAMRAAREANADVPGELALVSFDDFPWADLFHPRLTVVAQPTAVLGEQAAELVFSRLANPSVPTRRVVLTPTFVHRESCGCPQ